MLKVYVVFSDRFRTCVLAKAHFSLCYVITAGISGGAPLPVYMREECAARMCSEGFSFVNAFPLCCLLSNCRLLVNF